MRTVRTALALILAFAVPVRAETTTDPLWYLFSTFVVVPDTRAVEAGGEGPADTKRLAGLQADLILLSEGFESFRDEAQVRESLAKLEPRIAPELRPFFKDRASSLDAIYRTLAAVDYTWAQRFPEPPCSPLKARRNLLDGRDGLFQTPAGEASAWLVSLLGPKAKGKSAEQALDQASSKTKLSVADYERRRALVRKLTLALESEKAVGAARSKLYCSRASAFEELAAFQRDRSEGAVLASRSASQVAPEQSVFVVVSGSRRSAATLLKTKNGSVLLADASAVEGDEHPRLLAYSPDSKAVETTATVVRRDAALGLAILTYSEDTARPTLVLASTAPAHHDLVTALGHTPVSGPWTKTSGLVTKTGPEGFQTDAAVSVDFIGGPVLDDAGEVAGVLVSRLADTEEGRWPIAVSAAAISRWLEGGPATAVPGSESIVDDGTVALITRARPDSPAGLVVASLPAAPQGNIVCMKYCEGLSAPSRSYSSYSGGSSYDQGSAELGQAIGKLGAVLILKGIPALFRVIGKLFEKKNATSVKIVDNRHYTAPAEVKKKAEPPKEPLRPSTLELSLDRTEAARGEAITATVKMDFTGEEGARAGKSVTFEAAPKGLASFEPKTATTDGNGVARTRVRLTPLSEGAARFDALGDYEAKMRGEAVAETVEAGPKPGDAVGAVKSRESKQGDDLDREASKYQAAGEPTTAGTAQSNRVIVLEGRTVTITATAGGLRASTQVAVTDKRCPPGTAARPLDPENAAPGEPARGDTTEKLHDAACADIVREVARICGDANECVATERKKQGYESIGCGESRSKTPDYDRGSPPSWLPKEKRPEPRYECVPSATAVAPLGTEYRSETSPENSDTTRGTAPTQEELIARIWAILKPDGDHWSGERSGNAILMRMSGNAEDLARAAKNLFERLTAGLTVAAHPNPDIKGGQRARLGDVTISLRGTSQSGPPTVDINVPGQKPFKVKFINDP